MNLVAESGIVTALSRGLGSGGPDAAHAQAGWLIPTDNAVAGSDTTRHGKGPNTTLDDGALVYQCQGTNVGPMGALREGDGGVTSGVPFVAQTLNANMGRTYDSAGTGGTGPVNLIPDAQCVTGDVTHALTSEGMDASEDGALSVDLQNTRLGGEVAGTIDTTRPSRGGGQALMEKGVAGWGVRRLTPL